MKTYTKEEIEEQIHRHEGIVVHFICDHGTRFKKAYDQFHPRPLPEGFTIAELRSRMDDFIESQIIKS